MNSQDILNKTSYADILFTETEKKVINDALVIKQSRGASFPYIQCLIRKKEIKVTPEELVRQLFAYRLLTAYQYPASRIQVEVPINFGREVKRADIVVFDKDRPNVPYIIVELKKPKLKDGKEQLKSYCNATGAPIGIWTNGESIFFYHRKDPNYFEDLPGIPKVDQKLSDILQERWTIDDLIKKDKLLTERK
jgi:type I restriction enzyme M protein